MGKQKKKRYLGKFRVKTRHKFHQPEMLGHCLRIPLLTTWGSFGPLKIQENELLSYPLRGGEREREMHISVIDISVFFK